MEVITRAEAKERGLTKFYTGKPCKNGHYSKRFVSNYICVECNRTKVIKKRVKSKEPELDYAQIGKAIIERMKQLEKLATDSIDKDQEIKALTIEKSAAIRKIKEQHDTIEKLNIRIQQLNEARSNVGNDKFKLSELATIR